ncbi:MAG: 2-dehydropantoate 2-reductase [Burkholderiales bacterium]
MQKQKRIVMVGTGALGGYIGGNLAHQGFDVTFVDMWQENLDAIRTLGLDLDGVTAEEKFTVKTDQTLHLDKIQELGNGKPVDIAFVSVKSYDTERVTKAIKPFLAPDGYVVSLQNCINEDTIAGIVGADKTLGVIASIISVELYAAGKIRRMAAKGGDKHTVFRVGEVNATVSDRVNELVSMFSLIDSTKPTTNLFGERWSKLIQNSMRNGVAAATGLTSGECDTNEAPRRFAIKLGGEGVRVAAKLGIKLVGLGGMQPEQLAKASEGDAQAMSEVEAIMISRNASNPRAGIQRPSMAQDMQKGRRTEIEFMNGYIAAKGKEVGISTPNNLKLVDLVLRVQKGELKASAGILG